MALLRLEGRALCGLTLCESPVLLGLSGASTVQPGYLPVHEVLLHL